VVDVAKQEPKFFRHVLFCTDFAIRPSSFQILFSRYPYCRDQSSGYLVCYAVCSISTVCDCFLSVQRQVTRPIRMMAKTIPPTLVPRCFRVKADVRPIVRAAFSTSRNWNDSQRKRNTETASSLVLTRRDWPQNWTLTELAHLETMWKEGKTIDEMRSSGFQDRSLPSVREVVRVVFSRDTGQETLSSLNQRRITEDDKKEMLTLHEMGQTVQAISRQLARSASSIYSLFKALSIRPNRNRSRAGIKPFTAHELRILSSWMDREVFDHEIADNFPDRTTSSVRMRLYDERQKYGLFTKRRRSWSPADDAHLLALKADRPSTIKTAQFCRDVAPLFGHSVATTRARLVRLKKAEQKKSSMGQDAFTSKERSYS